MAEQSPQRKRKRRRPVETPAPNEKLQNWGFGLIAVGLVGLLLPSFGLQLRRLQALGDGQWIVLTLTVVVGSGAVFWANRSRPAFGGSIAGGACVVMLLFAYISFWRHPGAAAPAHPVAGGGGAVGVSGDVPMVNVMFEGEIPVKDFPLLAEFMKDCVPTATSMNYGHSSQPTGPNGESMVTKPHFAIGPVPNVEQLPGRITFGAATLIDAGTLRVQVRLPLPPPAESIRHRLDFALDGIRSEDVSRQRTGRLMLESLEPLDRRDEVAGELVEIMMRPNATMSVAGALKKWGTTQQAPALLSRMEQADANHAELLDVLTDISPNDAVDAAIQLIPSEPHLAESTLTRIGAVAESPVIALLTDSDVQVRLTACQVLLQIGTEASLMPLEPLQSDANVNVAAHARRAIEAIRDRLKR